MDRNRGGSPLDELGLTKAIREVPALAPPVLVSLALLEIVVARLPLDVGTNAPAVRTVLYVLGVLVGFIQYSLGNYWDEIWFDPRYSVREHRRGKWLEIEGRPLGVFPSGKDLDLARATCGLSYSDAVAVVRGAGRWDEVEGALLLSKFARSFIWPVLLVAAVFSVAAVWDLTNGRSDRGLAWASVGVVAFVMALLTFVPYAHYRVDHMLRLYRTAAAIGAAKPAATSSAAPSEMVGAGAALQASTASSSGERDARRGGALPWTFAALAALAAWTFASSMRTPSMAIYDTTDLHREVRELGRTQSAELARLRDELSSARRMPGNSVSPGSPELNRGGEIRATYSTAVGGRAASAAVLLSGLLLVVAGVSLARVPSGKAAGAALATLGTLLSVGSVSVFKDLHVDSVFKMADSTILKLIHQETARVCSAGPEPIGSILGFRPGSADEFDGDVAAALEEAAQRWIAKRRAAQDGVLLVVGSTDRVPLGRKTASRYEANVGLARARAEEIKGRLLETLRRRAPGLEPKPENVLVLVSGPQHTPAGVRTAHSDGTRDDRRVDLWAFWSPLPQSRSNVVGSGESDDAAGPRAAR